MSDPLPLPSTPGLTVGDWQFYPSIHELRRGDERRRLPRRLALILAELARSPGAPVSRDELIARCWRRRVIDDEVLSRSIGELRALLGDAARRPRYIETIPKGGYRLIAPVLGSPDLPTAARAPAAVADAVVPPSAAPAPSRSRWHLPGLAALLVLLTLAGAVAWRRSAAPATRWTAAVLAAEHPYASSPGWEYDPRYSRDGRWIAFVRSDPPGAASRVWIAERAGTAARPLTPEAGNYTAPVFGPNGAEVWFEARSKGHCEVRRQALFAAGAERVVECAPRVSGGLDWSPDGTQLAYIAPGVDGQGGTLSLWDPATHRSRALTVPDPADGPDGDPRFSPDGRLSYVRGPDTERRLLWLDPRNPEKSSPLIDDRNSIEGHAWTPDGTRVLVATDRHDFRALIALDPATGTVTRLGGRGASGIDIAADGSVLYSQAVYNANLWISPLPAKADSAKILAATTRYASQPTLSPDDRFVAYVANAAGREAVWLRDIAANTERRLPLDAQLRWVRPSFMPDGRSLLLTAYDANGPQAWRHDLVSGRSTRLGADAALARWSDDGRVLVLARRDADDFALYVATDAAGTAEKPIPQATGVGEFHVGRRYVAWAGRNDTGVQLYDVDTGTVRRIAPRIGPHNRYDWLLRDDVLYFCDYATDRTPTLYRLDPSSDEPEVALGTIQPDTIGTSIAVAHEARFVVFGHVDRLDIDLMMAETVR